MRLYKSTLMIYLLSILCCIADKNTNLSSPENTIKTFYKGYIEGKKSMTELARGGEKISDISFSLSTIYNYEIDTIKISDAGDGFFRKIGDVEIVVKVFQDKNKSLQPYKVKHRLREINNNWYSLRHAVLHDDYFLKYYNNIWYLESDNEFYPGIIDADPDPMLATPEKTINHYYTGFMKGMKSYTEKAAGGIRFSDNAFNPPNAKSYKVITKKICQDDESGRLKGDIEFIVEVYYEDSIKLSSRKWHLLRKFNENWISVSHSYIPDENHPDMDPKEIYELDTPDSSNKEKNNYF